MSKESDIIQNTIETGGEANGLYLDACTIIEQAQREAYRQVNETLIKRNWLLGMRIQLDVLKDKRAEYGEQVVKCLSKQLTTKYGIGYSRNNLYRFIAFYKSFPEIFHAMSRKSEIVPSLTGLLEGIDVFDIVRPIYPLKLSWTHYSIILQDSNIDARQMKYTLMF